MIPQQRKQYKALLGRKIVPFIMCCVLALSNAFRFTSSVPEKYRSYVYFKKMINYRRERDQYDTLLGNY